MCVFPLDDTLRKNLNLRFKRFCINCEVFKSEIGRLNRESDGIYSILLDLIEELKEKHEIYQKIKLSYDAEKHQLTGIAKLSRIFQTSLDIRKIVHATASVITAGEFLGFNRAFVLLKDGEYLKGFYAIGPRTPEEAAKIWREIEEKNLSLEEIIEYDEEKFEKEAKKFRNTLEKFRLRIEEVKSSLERISWLRVTDNTCEGLFRKISKIINNCNYLVVPLRSDSELIGLIIADNPFSHVEMDEDKINKLEMIVFPASISISRALLHKEVLDKARELERMNQALRRYQETITQLEKMEALGEIINQIAHDIKNPATIIGGIAKSLLEDFPADDPRYEYLKAIYDEARNLVNLINFRIRNFREQFVEKPDWWRVEDILKKVLESKSAILRARNIQCYYDIEDTGLEFLVNLGDISRCFEHVIQNSIEAMPEGGKLTVSLKRLDESSIMIQISDTGVGIDEKFSERVFEPAFTTKENGWGMGLYFCKKKLKFYGGDITLKGKPGEGVTVTIVLKNGKNLQEVSHGSIH